MNIFKKVIALSIAAIIALTPAISLAEDVLISAPEVNAEEKQVKEADYIEFSGKITEVNMEDENSYILVENDKEDEMNALRVYLGDSVLLSDETLDFADKDKLKEDVKVSVFYHKNTPMGLSLPPVLTPDAIVIRETEEPTSVMVAKFDEELLNDKGDLFLLVSEKTNIIDAEGNKMDHEAIKNRDLLVFYSIVLESYPAQTHPEKIVVLPIKEELPVEEPEEETPTEVKEVILSKESLFVNDKGVTMIPLRFVAEELGYEVKWNAEARTVEIQKGPQWSLITIGEDNYNFAKMLVKLGTAPVIVKDHTFVPLNFAEEVLVSEVVILEDGGVKIVQK